MKPKIGIIGFGFLGRALAHGFNLYSDMKIYDKYDKSFDTLIETVNESDYIFVSVPTPMKDDGSQDLTNIYDAVDNIARVAKEGKIIILRSTIIPGTTRKIAYKYTKHDFVFFPEFLTERTAKMDFINASRLIFGGQKHVTEIVETLFRNVFHHTPIFHTTWEGAEVAKYMSNCFFAIKVIFQNEMYDVAERIGIPYNVLRDMWLASGWVANMHTDVPGHDGDRGYGGKCFPKDVKAFIAWAESEGLTMDVCKAADKVNERIRKNKDWFNIPGCTSGNNFNETSK
jgi:UDPglucose 6-dehydrogenase